MCSVCLQHNIRLCEGVCAHASVTGEDAGRSACGHMCEKGLR